MVAHADRTCATLRLWTASTAYTEERGKSIFLWGHLGIAPTTTTRKKEDHYKGGMLPLDIILHIGTYTPSLALRGVSRDVYAALMRRPEYVCRCTGVPTTIPMVLWPDVQVWTSQTQRCSPACRDISHYTFTHPENASTAILHHHLWSRAPRIEECDRAGVQLRCLESELRSTRETRRLMVAGVDARIAELASGLKLARSMANRMRRRRGRVARIVHGNLILSGLNTSE